MKYKFLLKLFFVLIFSSSVFAQKIDLSNVNISVRDFILLKYDLFFLKNKQRLVAGQVLRLMIDYQYVSFDLKVDDSNKFVLRITAVMNKKRYKQKRYYPKNSDCNIVRNKLFMNKYGYTFWKRKQSYAFDEDDLRDVILNQIYKSDNLSEKQLRKILTDVKNSIIMQIKSLLRLDDIEIKFSNNYYDQVSKLAIQSKMGARALKSLVENSLINIMFRIDEFNNNGVHTIRFDNYPYNDKKPVLVYEEREEADGNYKLYRGIDELEK